MPEPLLFLKAMGTAATASAIFVLAMNGLRRPLSTTWINSSCALAIGLGLAVGYRVMSLRLDWPPANGLDRLLTIVIPIALVIELIAGLGFVAAGFTWCMRLCLAAAIPRILLHGSVYLSGGDGTLWQAGTMWTVCSALLAGVWLLLSRLSQRRPGVSIPVALCLTTQCAGLTIMMAGYIEGGAAALPMAATVAATPIAGWLMMKRGVFSATPGAAAILGIGIVGLFGLLFVGRYFGRLSTGSALAMLLAPLMCWATETPRLRAQKPWLVGSLRLVLVSIPLIAVLAVAKRDFDRDMAPLLGKHTGVNFSSSVPGGNGRRSPATSGSNRIPQPARGIIIRPKSSRFNRRHADMLASLRQTTTRNGFQNSFSARRSYC